MIPLPWAKPGAKVICIRDRPWRTRGPSGGWILAPPHHTLPQFMREYMIKGVGTMRNGRVGLTFLEFTNPPNRLGREPLFAATYFRPVLSLPEMALTMKEETE